MMTRRWFLKASAAAAASASACGLTAADQAFTISPSNTVGGVIFRPHRLEVLHYGEVTAIASVSESQAVDWRFVITDKIRIDLDAEDRFEADGARLIIDGEPVYEGLFWNVTSKHLFPGDRLSVTIHRAP